MYYFKSRFRESLLQRTCELERGNGVLIANIKKVTKYMNYCKDVSVNFMSVLCVGFFLSIGSYKDKYLPNLRAAAIKRLGIPIEWRYRQNCNFVPVINSTSYFHSYLCLTAEAPIKHQQVWLLRNKLAV